MIDFLSESGKQKILEHKKWKIISILGIVVFSALVCLYLFLILINNLIGGKAEEYRISFEQQKKENLRWEEVEKKIDDLNSSFSDLRSFYDKQRNISFLIERIFDNIPQSSYLSNFSFVRLEKDKKIEPKEEFWAKVSVSGFCPNREDLLLLKSNLENEKIFEKKDIYLPPSGWVEAEDVNFITTINVKETFNDLR